MGYENPSNVYDYEQKCKSSEWTVFIQTKNPTFRPMISQFLKSADFFIPKRAKPFTVLAPEPSVTNVQESKANYQLKTKVNRNLFKLDAKNKVI